MASGYKYVGGRANKVLEHILVAERALGKKLPPGACVHHVDGNGLNNRPDNLVICESLAYHSHLHARIRARDKQGAWQNPPPPEFVRVTPGIANSRKTHCPYGHLYDYGHTNPGMAKPIRGCLTCRNDAARRYGLRRAAKRLELKGRPQ